MEYKLRIGSTDWTVKTVTDLQDEDGTSVHGLTLCDEREIHISSELSDSEANLTLLHEVLHAALFETGHNEMLESESAEEGMVRALSHVLCPLIHENKLNLQK
jgi:Zn-dependent peptidase ImmA (M78 family)